MTLELVLADLEQLRSSRRPSDRIYLCGEGPRRREPLGGLRPIAISGVDRIAVAALTIGLMPGTDLRTQVHGAVLIH